MSVQLYIKKLQGLETFAFSWHELKNNSDKTETALKSELARLVKKKEIINIRKGFYLIIPIRFVAQNTLPIHYFIHKFFKEIQQPYYLSFYSAAKFYGATHQQIHEDFVVTTKPLLKINKNKIIINFFTVVNFPKKNLVSKKSDAGIFFVSDPILTVLDLIHFQSKLGGFNRIITVINELSELIEESDLLTILSWYPYKGTLQRFGYLLEYLDKKQNIRIILKSYLKENRYFTVKLDLKNPLVAAPANEWKIIPNSLLELDI